MSTWRGLWRKETSEPASRHILRRFSSHEVDRAHARYLGFIMPLMFNSILKQEGVAPAETILVRHQDQRAEKGRTPFELWRFDALAFDAYQSNQNPNRRSQFSRASYWASFVATPAGDTLFIGVYRAAYVCLLDQDRPKPHMRGVDVAGSNDVYNLQRQPAFDDLIGRLTIEWGEGARAWIQRAELQNKPVAELRQRDADPRVSGLPEFLESAFANRSVAADMDCDFQDFAGRLPSHLP